MAAPEHRWAHDAQARREHFASELATMGLASRSLASSIHATIPAGLPSAPRRSVAVRLRLERLQRIFRYEWSAHVLDSERLTRVFSTGAGEELPARVRLAFGQLHDLEALAKHAASAVEGLFAPHVPQEEYASRVRVVSEAARRLASHLTVEAQVLEEDARMFRSPVRHA